MLTTWRDNGHSRLLRYAALAFALYWLVLAIAPVNRFDWFLENLLVFAGAVVFVATYRKFPLSSYCYLLILIFLALHSLGAHYTYSQTPIGNRAAEIFGHDRNHFDRLVHFSFGLLFYYPIKEFLDRYLITGKCHWQTIISLSFILALSSLYELLEWAAAIILKPEDALAFLGTQGDVFDAQKDAGLAFTGGLLAVLLSRAARLFKD
ncbi:MAG: DUF2238 domain-containing protein [Kiloniellales bacterium]|nr:DUF2238 domain-containing protein [Kiloniellales bacterium]